MKNEQIKENKILPKIDLWPIKRCTIYCKITGQKVREVWIYENESVWVLDN